MLRRAWIGEWKEVWQSLYGFVWTPPFRMAETLPKQLSHGSFPPYDYYWHFQLWPIEHGRARLPLFRTNATLWLDDSIRYLAHSAVSHCSISNCGTRLSRSVGNQAKSSHRPPLLHMLTGWEISCQRYWLPAVIETCHSKESLWNHELCSNSAHQCIQRPKDIAQNLQDKLGNCLQGQY